MTKKIRVKHFPTLAQDEQKNICLAAVLHTIRTIKRGYRHSRKDGTVEWKYMPYAEYLGQYQEYQTDIDELVNDTWILIVTDSDTERVIDGLYLYEKALRAIQSESRAHSKSISALLAADSESDSESESESEPIERAAAASVSTIDCYRNMAQRADSVRELYALARTQADKTVLDGIKDGYSQTEIAKALNVTPQAIKSRLNLMKKRDSKTAEYRAAEKACHTAAYVTQSGTESHDTTASRASAAECPSYQYECRATRAAEKETDFYIECHARAAQLAAATAETASRTARAERAESIRESERARDARAAYTAAAERAAELITETARAAAQRATGTARERVTIAEYIGLMRADTERAARLARATERAAKTATARAKAQSERAAQRAAEYRAAETAAAEIRRHATAEINERVRVADRATARVTKIERAARTAATAETATASQKVLAKGLAVALLNIADTAERARATRAEYIG